MKKSVPRLYIVKLQSKKNIKLLTDSTKHLWLIKTLYTHNNHSNLYYIIVYNYIIRAMSSDRNKDLFLKQVGQILDGIKQDRDQLVQRCQDERKDRDSLNITYLELIEKQRAYYKTVKDFQEVN